MTPSTPDEEDGPPPLPSGNSSQFPLRSREELVAAELARIDPQLEGLFRIGHELCARGPLPGLSYTIAEAGRELSVGVINVLAEGAPPLSEDELRVIGPEEKHRGPIALALRLHPRHPLVTAWLEIHSRLNGEAHYVANRGTAGAAISDFLDLSSLLVGRLAPYFDAQDEADALLAVGEPGYEHVDSLRRVLVRPALRRYFLAALQNPAWLEPLKSLNAFANPPRRHVNPDKSWSMVPWLEGEYLARVAWSKPGEVAELLESVPTDNDNPAVWDIVARAAVELPIKHGKRLLIRIAAGLRSVPRIALPATLIKLGQHLVSTDPRAATELLNVMLWIRRNEPVVEVADSDIGSRTQYSTRWLLERVDIEDAEEVLSALVPAIAEGDPRGLLELLAQKLRAAMRGMNPAFEEEPARESAYWCRDIGGSDDKDDLRAMIARSIARVSITLSALSPDDAIWTAKFLMGLPQGIGERLLYFVASRSSPHFAQEVDELLMRTDVFEWHVPGREAGDVFRSRFTEASQPAQAAFARRLSDGPPQDELDRMAKLAVEYGDADATEESERRRWQIRHLRRFGANLPKNLMPLAEHLSYVPTQPDTIELALTEDGWHSGGASWVGEVSPFTAEQLFDGSPGEIAERIQSWVPEPGIDRPTLRGLEQAIEEATAANVELAIAVAQSLLKSETARGTAAILTGVSHAFKNGATLPWGPLGDLLQNSLGLTPKGGREEAEEWRQLKQSAIGLAEKTVLESGPPSLVTKLLNDGLSLLDDPDLWHPASGDDYESMDGIITASINVSAARLVHLVIRLALRHYRDRVSGEPNGVLDPEEVRREIGRQVHNAIPNVLSRTGRAGLAARAALGTYLPQLLWLAPEWWEERYDEVLGDGIASPLTNPIWASYLVRGALYNNSFNLLRPVYAKAALAPRRTAEKKRRSWEPEPHLLEHVLIAVLRGLARPGDEDQLVESAFSQASSEDSSHAYWTIFRGWTDATENGETIPTELVDRLVSFWSWRLDQLEAASGSEAKNEASGLLWFCRTPAIPAQDVIALGQRTLRLVGDTNSNLHVVWERLAELATHDVDGAFVLLELAVEVELRSQWRHFPIDEIEPVFIKVFASGSLKTRTAALRLLNRLGEDGFSEFGRLRPAQ